MSFERGEIVKFIFSGKSHYRLVISVSPHLIVVRPILSTKFHQTLPVAISHAEYIYEKLSEKESEKIEELLDMYLLSGDERVGESIG